MIADIFCVSTIKKQIFYENGVGSKQIWGVVTTPQEPLLNFGCPMNCGRPRSRSDHSKIHRTSPKKDQLYKN
jgi:hypothetical protein